MSNATELLALQAGAYSLPDVDTQLLDPSRARFRAECQRDLCATAEAAGALHVALSINPEDDETLYQLRNELARAVVAAVTKLEWLSNSRDCASEA